MKNTVKVERAKKDITQQELADSLSVSRQTIIAIESGKFNPSVKLALKMDSFFGCSVQELFLLEDGD